MVACTTRSSPSVAGLQTALCSFAPFEICCCSTAERLLLCDVWLMSSAPQPVHWHGHPPCKGLMQTTLCVFAPFYICCCSTAERLLLCDVWLISFAPPPFHRQGHPPCKGLNFPNTHIPDHTCMINKLQTTHLFNRHTISKGIQPTLQRKHTHARPYRHFQQGSTDPPASPPHHQHRHPTLQRKHTHARPYRYFQQGSTDPPASLPHHQQRHPTYPTKETHTCQTIQVFSTRLHRPTCFTATPSAKASTLLRATRSPLAKD